MTPHTVDEVQRNRRGRTLDEPTVCLEQTDEVSWFFTRKCAVNSLVKLGIKNVVLTAREGREIKMYIVILINNLNNQRFEKKFSSPYLMQNFIRKVRYGKKLTYLGHYSISAKVVSRTRVDLILVKSPS